MTLFRFNHYSVTTKKFSSDIVQALSKRNRFSIGHCAKFAGHVRCPTVISHPVDSYENRPDNLDNICFADSTASYIYEKADINYEPDAEKS